jgi:hypothetical protein
VPESQNSGFATNAQQSARIARRLQWAQALVRKDTAPIDAAFVAGGTHAPEIVWRPQAADCTPPINSFLLAHWGELAPADGLPPTTAIDPTIFATALGYVHLVEPVEGDGDFRYRVFGSLVSSVSGFDVTGKLMSDFAASDYVVDFGVAVCAAAVARRMPVLTRRRPNGATDTKFWERLVLPFAGADGAIDRLLVGMLPVNASGRVIRPTY